MFSSNGRPVVVKVGGSLFDLPELGKRLRRWITHHALRQVVLVPGGGAMADAVRSFDQCQRLTEGAAHWFALRATTLNALMLATVVDGGPVEDLAGCSACWQIGRLPVLDAHRFAVMDEARNSHLPHSWAVTTDSIAARAAIVFSAGQLILLKSTTMPGGIDWTEAGRRGFVDPYFEQVLKQADLDVQVVNFRTWQP